MNITMPCKTSKEYADMGLKTKLQWEKEGQTPIDEKDGICLWSNHFCNAVYMYYRPDQVRDMSEEELSAYKKKLRDKRLKAKCTRKKREAAELKQEIEERVAREIPSILNGWSGCIKHSIKYITEAITYYSRKGGDKHG